MRKHRWLSSGALALEWGWAPACPWTTPENFKDYDALGSSHY